MTHKYIVSCDLETTDLSPNVGCFITGSFGLIETKTLTKVDEIEIEARPYHWSEAAYNVHKIDYKTACLFDTRKDAVNKLEKFLPKEQCYFLCHSLKMSYHFDFAFLINEFSMQDKIFSFYKRFDPRYIISTVTMARKRKMQSSKLNYLCDYYGIELNHHDAKSDRLACEKIYMEFVNDKTQGSGSTKHNPQLSII